MVLSPPSTPTRGLEIIFDVPPLYLHFQKEAIKAFLRLKPTLIFGWSGEYGNKTYNISHMKFWEKKAEHLELDEQNLDTCNEL